MIAKLRCIEYHLDKLYYLSSIVKMIPSYGSEIAHSMPKNKGFGVPVESITVDESRNALLSVFGKEMLKDRYLHGGENFQGLFRRVAAAYASDVEHGQRLYNYMSKLWFMPATPILSNGGLDRGLPISCFLNEVQDSLTGIVDTWNENTAFASHGGGIGTSWANVRSIGEVVKGAGKTSGIIPFIGVQDRLTLAISQGSLRRGSAAVYLDVSHPEIEEFLEIRRPTGGDPNRKALNLHHGVIIPDKFMEAVQKDLGWELLSPKDKSVVARVRARDLWIKILSTRMETGEPYMLFIDNVKKGMGESYKRLGLDVKTSNLCVEIMLATGRDHRGMERSAVCCLSSLNIEKYEKWSGNKRFYKDIYMLLDNVLQDFIQRAPSQFERAKYSAMRERSVGLGVMGFHSFLQSKSIPFESALAKSWNKKIFKEIYDFSETISQELAEERGACPDAIESGLKERFTHKTAIAPTASISVIAGNSSPCIEPYNANAYTQKTLSGSFNVKNKHLMKLLDARGKNTEEVWSSIMVNSGSVQHLDFLTDDEKKGFKTAFEIDQRWVIEFAADRQKYISQSQSLNLFLPSDISKKELHILHMLGWKKGVKSYYYNRSYSPQRADSVSIKHEKEVVQLKMDIPVPAEDCLACQ